MKLVKIGSLFQIEKGSLQSSKSEPGEYDFITASSEWKSHKTYTHDAEAIIVAVAASGSLGRTHYANGKFIASDLCFILTPKPQYSGKISLPFYEFIFGALREDLVKKTATGTAKQAINLKNFSNYSLPLFSPQEQEAATQRLKFAFSGKNELIFEISHQQSLLTKLKQAILQEAIQGKLTADWRAVNPDVETASKLLERIKAEKARLIAEKKIRKEKPLPKITDEEILFDIPEGWEWCRLGELGYTQTGTTPDTTTPANYGNYIPFIKPGNIDDNGITYDGQGLSELGLQQGRLVEADSLLMVCIGSSTGKVAVTNRQISCNQQINVITFLGNTSHDCLELILKSPYFQTILWSNTKTGITPIINKTKWASIPVPLPPLLEQIAIVKAVTSLMITCRSLESEIEHSRQTAESLLQAVLKEAFATAS